MGSAAPRKRPLGIRMTVFRAPVVMPHATGLRCLALGHRAAATRAGSTVHRSLYPADAIDPFIEKASAQGVARAANPAQPGETRGQVLRAGTVQPWTP